ncbi:hypothetical protein [Streptomyces griseorubiginosus]|uniref:hypothetical protein n=1 Tax=Streptomyces griseorubiginosus TaxID=67304 RepID=UPI001AD632DA|nr:hypothetical protein [Streptomyces griseorubiginosus]MBO4258382.1 hypothetical protein [Streptomyces griseorubiginosus]
MGQTVAIARSAIGERVGGQGYRDGPTVEGCVVVAEECVVVTGERLTAGLGVGFCSGHAPPLHFTSGARVGKNRFISVDQKHTGRDPIPPGLDGWAAWVIER